MSKHKYGYICTWCGKISFYTDVKPEKGQQIRSENFYKPDDSQPKPGESITCTKCGEGIFTMYVENIVELGKQKHSDDLLY